MFKINKKASLNLSINAIVIIVLAMTLMGLGLGFIRNIFSGFEEQREEITEQVRAQILEDLRTGNKPLAFPATDINVEKGSAKTMAFGVRNTKALETLSFKIDVGILQTSIGGCKYKYDGAAWAQMGTSPAGISCSAPSSTIDFFYNEGPFSLTVGRDEVYSVRATTVGDKGVYMARIRILSCELGGTETVADCADVSVLSSNVYAEKTFFINNI